VTSTGTLMSYDEVIAVLEAVPVILRETRRRKGCSLRQAGAELGLSNTGVLQVERVGNPTLATTIAVLRWAAS
jgi:transcriptional regulator with XRE-family HTH domain